MLNQFMLNLMQLEKELVKTLKMK